MLRRRDCLYLLALPALRAQTPPRTLTAATAARLYDSGLLDLDARPQKYAPSFPDKGPPITARQLLGHLAGIWHYGTNEYINTTHYATVRDGLKIFLDSPLVQPPSFKYFYSSYGYNLLGLVIEGAPKMEFTACVQKEVLDPLDMKGTGTGEGGPNVSHFYATSDGKVDEAPGVDNSDRLASGGFLKPATRALIFTSQKAADGKETGVGFGWRIAQIGGESVYHHGGDLLLRPEHNLSVGIAANLSFARIAEANAMALSQQFAV